MSHSITVSRPVKRIAVILFDGVNALDVAGPVEAFACATYQGQIAYTVETWAIQAKQVRTESGLSLMADRLLAARDADILVIPGGKGIRQSAVLGNLSSWLRDNHQRFERVVSICTGAYALAESGLVDGKTITTHWQFSNDLQARYPKVEVTSAALFLQDGRFYTSGGITAGIDLALDIIEADCGLDTAMSVARELVVYLRRSGVQAQFSTPLKAQSANSDRLRGIADRITNNLDTPLSVQSLATDVNLSPRQFTRRFKAEFGIAPAQFVKQVRLDTARTMLDQGCEYLQVADSVGFQSNDGFRRAFEARFGITPLEYQKRFHR